jgi:hypothetical protein
VKRFQQRQRTSLLVSIAVHAVVIALIATITFHYPIGALLGLDRARKAAPERLQYMVLPAGPVAPVGNGSNPTATPPKGPPAPLRAPTSVPTTLPEPPAAGQSAGAVSGREGGTGGAPTGMATGIEPMAPDPRLPLAPGDYISAPKTMAQRVDSTMRAAFQAQFDSMALAEKNAPRDPRDWTIDRNGQKWGLDQKYIHLGKWKLPSAVLALLPLQPGGVDGNRVIEGRNAAFIRRDVLEHAQRSIREDEFKAAVRRIRERKERERREQEKTIAATGKGTSAPTAETRKER